MDDCLIFKDSGNEVLIYIWGITTYFAISAHSWRLCSGHHRLSARPQTRHWDQGAWTADDRACLLVASVDHISNRLLVTKEDNVTKSSSLY